MTNGGYYLLKQHHRGGAYLNKFGCPVVDDDDGVILTNQARWQNPLVARYATAPDLLRALLWVIHETDNHPVPMWVHGGNPPVLATQQLSSWLSSKDPVANSNAGREIGA